MGTTQNAVVRANAGKITATEIYHYRAEIADHTSIVFEEATGEIKIAYLFDGERRDFRWIGRNFWTQLYKTSKILSTVGKWLTWFFNLWFIFGVTKLLGLRWLWRNLVRLLLGPEPGKRYFGVAGLADARKYSSSQPTALVGHLALRGYRKPTFPENWPEHKPLKLEIPIDRLEERLAGSQKHEVQLQYTLAQPEAPPVHLKEVRLTDEALDQDEQRPFLDPLHSANDELLNLRVDLEIDGGQPALDETGKVPADLVRRWWHMGFRSAAQSDRKKEAQKNGGRASGKNKNGHSTNETDEEDTPLQEQIYCLRGLPDTAELMKALNYLQRRGGYLLVHLTPRRDETDTLKSSVLEAALGCRPFVPILEPYAYQLDGKPLVVVPVLKQATQQLDYWPSHLHLTSNLRLGINTAVTTIAAGDSRRLAITLAALANTDGGVIRIEDKDNKGREEIYNTVGVACQIYCNPPFDLDRKNLADHTWHGHRNLLLELNGNSATLYSVDQTVYKWENGEPAPLEAEAVYALLKSRCALDLPLILPRPTIAQAHIKWPRFDARESHCVRYDPRKRVVKWIYGIVSREIQHHRFAVGLPLKINRPLELYTQQNLKAQIQVELTDKLVSGLEFDYFNGLGERRPLPQGGWPLIEKKSKIILDLDITPQAIFRQRWFTSERKLEFEGVPPAAERLNDIQEILANLGQENIQLEPARVDRDDRFKIVDERFIREKMSSGGWWVYGHKPGLLRLDVYIEGEPLEIIRERGEGDRVDEMPVQAGKTQITIKGRIRSQSPAQLLTLLNQLQHMLKERFDCVRYQVV